MGCKKKVGPNRSANLPENTSCNIYFISAGCALFILLTCIIHRPFFDIAKEIQLRQKPKFRQIFWDGLKNVGMDWWLLFIFNVLIFISIYIMTKFFGKIEAFTIVSFTIIIGSVFLYISIHISKQEDVTKTKKNTIDKSVKLYAKGLTDPSAEEVPNDLVYVMSRCIELNPHLLKRIDDFQRGKLYNNVILIVHTDSEIVGNKDVYEIFGALLRIYRLKNARVIEEATDDEIEKATDIVSNGIKLFLLPKDRTKEVPINGYTIPIEPIDHKIVCTKRNAVIGKTLKEERIDNSALVLDIEAYRWEGLWLHKHLRSCLEIYGLKKTGFEGLKKLLCDKGDLKEEVNKYITEQIKDIQSYGLKVDKYVKYSRRVLHICMEKILSA